MSLTTRHEHLNCISDLLISTLMIDSSIPRVQFCLLSSIQAYSRCHQMILLTSRVLSCAKTGSHLCMNPISFSKPISHCRAILHRVEPVPQPSGQTCGESPDR